MNHNDRTRQRQSRVEWLEPRFVLDSTVVFNELMYHPADNSGMPEWLELYNQMSYDMDLSGWSLQGGITFDFPSGTSIPSGGFLVVSESPSQLQSATGFANALGPYDLSLSNAGELVELRDPNHRIMDSIDYGDSAPWPVAPDGSGTSLAKISANLASVPPENWSSSLGVDGTPGTGNEMDVVTTNFVTLDSDWRYHDLGLDLGTSWRNAGFNDTAWSVGSGLFFDEDDPLPGPKNTPLNPAHNTYYFRNSFTFHGDPATAALELSLVVDDGAVVYLNGTEIHRENMPLGTISFDTHALTEVDDASQNALISIPSSSLVIGTNVLAVELHQVDSAAVGKETVAYYRFENAGISIMDDVSGHSHGFRLGGTSSTSVPVATVPQTGAANTRSVNLVGGLARISGTPFLFHHPAVGGAVGDATLEWYMNVPADTGHSAMFWSRTGGADADRFNLFWNIGSGDAARQIGGDYRAPDTGGPYSMGNAYNHTPLSLNTWHHIAIVRHDNTPFDTGDANFTWNWYVDGALVPLSSRTTTAPLPNIDNGWLIAGRSDANSLNARFDEIRLTNGALSPGEFLNAVPGQESGDDEDAVFGAVLNVKTPPSSAGLTLNELSAVTAAPFQVELMNHGNTSFDMAGYVLEESEGSGSFVLPSQTLQPGDFVSLTASQIGFTPTPGARLFLYTPDRREVIDAMTVDSLSRGRFPDGTGPWYFPDQATFGASNLFDFHDEIVINEIMYHPYAELNNPAISLPDGIGSVTSRVVESGADATYLVPSDDTLGDSWHLPLFDDSSWASGPSGIGFESGAASGVVAYGNLTGASGSFSGSQSFGHDFVVNSTISVTHLGVFDSEANGLSRTLTAELWSRHGNSGNKIADMVFLPGDTGTLVDSNRFKPLTVPIELVPGDYSIAAYGYGSAEPVGHGGFGGPGAAFKTLDDGNGVISFVGSSRLGFTPGSFPSLVDSGSVNYYSAGTFQFDAGSVISPLVSTDVEADLVGVNGSIYTRFEFMAAPPGPAEQATLSLGMKYDDGFVAYLNGTEVARRNAPAVVDFNSTAAGTGQAISDFEVIDISAHLDQLMTGLNVLAIHGLNVSAADSDFFMLPNLDLTTTLQVGDWLELYNRGATSVDLSNWRIQDAVDYTFPPGTTLDPASYLVVAQDSARLQTHFPNATILGDYSGRLSNREERITLIDQNGNLADEVHYYENKPWPKFADGGGSSLELQDPRADNAHAGAWVASDEATRTTWKTYRYRGTPSIGSGTFHLGLLDEGTVLLDDIRVVADPDGVATELFSGGNFESGLGSWLIQGTHRVEVITDPDDAGNQVLQLTASAHMTDNHNQLRKSIASTSSFIEHEISFRARWVTGTNLVHTFVSGHRLPGTTRIDLPGPNGTPGSVNSTFVNNLGPTMHDMHHSPIVPSSSDSVTVTVSTEDPDGIASVRLQWSVNGGSYQTTTMTSNSDGTYAGTIPPQASGSVQFYVEATDGLGAMTMFPAAGPDSRAMFIVEDNQAQSGNLHNLRIILTGSDISTLHSSANALSNQRQGATVIVNESEVYYDVDVRVSGGASRGTISVGYNIRFNADHLFRGVHDTLTVDRNNLNETFTRQLYLRTTGIPAFYSDMIFYVWPGGDRTGFAQIRMARYDDVYLDSQFTNGSDGMLFEKEIVAMDIQDRGSDKEAYRWSWLIKNNRWRDDYDRMVDLNQAFSLTGQALDDATKEVMDVDQWLRVFASARLFGNRDFYSQPLVHDPNNSERHNVFFYARPSDNKVIALPWDVDESFQVPINSTITGNTNLAKVVQLPGNLRRTYGHLHDLIDTTFNASVMTPIGSHLSSIFTTVDYASPQTYIEQRTAYVLSQLPVAIPFEITTHGGENFTVGTSTVTLSGNAWYRVKDIFIAGQAEPLQMDWIDDDTWQIDLGLSHGENAFHLEGYDYQGNLIASDSITVHTTAGAPSQQDLRITELHYNPHDSLPQFGEPNVDNDDYEFIELVNDGSQPIDLQGVKLVEVDVGGEMQGVVFEFAAQTLNAQERMVVVQDVAAFWSRFGTEPRIALGDDGAGGDSGEYGGKLSNGGERITLLDNTGTTIQQFDYDDGNGWPERADGTGSSLEAVSTSGNYQDPTNWNSSIDFGGSPASVGSAPAADVLVNEVLANSTLPAQDTIELINTTGSTVDVSGWFLSDSNDDLFQYSFPVNTTIAANSYLLLDEGDFNPGGGANTTDFALSSFGDDVWLLSVDALGRPDKFEDRVEFSATFANTTMGRFPNADPDSDLVPLVEPSLGSENRVHRVSELILSEVHYNPPGPDAGMEFLELVNATSASVQLADWRVNQAVDQMLPAATIAPGEAVVLVDFDPLLNTAQDTAFRSAYGIDGSVRLFGPWQLGDVLDDGGEKINLELKNEVLEPGSSSFSYYLSDQVVYDDVAPWPVSSDADGDSLHRLAPSAYGNMVSSWVASGPTPGTYLAASAGVAHWNGDSVTGGTGDGTSWTDANNWSNAGSVDTQPANAAPFDEIYFLSAPSVGTIELGGNRTVHSLTFEDSYVLSGNTLTLTGNTVSVVHDITARVDSHLAGSDFAKNGMGTLAVGGSSPDWTIYEGTFVLTAGGTTQDVSVSAGATAQLNGVVQGNLINDGLVSVGVGSVSAVHHQQSAFAESGPIFDPREFPADVLARFGSDVLTSVDEVMATKDVGTSETEVLGNYQAQRAVVTDAFFSNYSASRQKKRILWFES